MPQPCTPTPYLGPGNKLHRPLGDTADSILPIRPGGNLVTIKVTLPKTSPLPRSSLQLEAGAGNPSAPACDSSFFTLTGVLQLMSPPSHSLLIHQPRGMLGLMTSWSLPRIPFPVVSATPTHSSKLFLLHELFGHSLCTGHPPRPPQICSFQVREQALFKSATLASRPLGVISAWTEKGRGIK